MKKLLVAGLCLGSCAALAQQSASFDTREQVINSGGAPENGSAPSSASFGISLLAIGDPLAARGSSSASFRTDIGFVSAYPAPGEVSNVLFLDATTLTWDGEPSAVLYHRYQGTVAVPFDPGYGSCAGPPAGTNVMAVPETPAPGATLFVLLTAENRLGEEGTKGQDSFGSSRANPAPCP